MLMNIEKLKSKIAKLSKSDKKDLIDFIKTSYSIFDDFSSVHTCPSCHSENIVKNGTRNSITRYLCKDCKKSFTFKSNSVLSGVQEINKWNEFVEDFLCMNISSLKSIKEKLNICEQTAFNWRHKLISALTTPDNSTLSREILEFDEAYFLISRKGRDMHKPMSKSVYRKWRRSQTGDSKHNVKIFFTYSRNSENLELYRSHMGRTHTEDLQNYFGNRLNNTSVFTDRHPTYKSFFKDLNGVKHETFLAKNHINLHKPEVHNQTVNAYTRGFKEFVNYYMRGVSSKYIHLYAKWYQFIINVSKMVKDLNFKKRTEHTANIICSKIVSNKTAVEVFREAEMKLLLFLKKNGRNNYGTCFNHYYRKHIEVIKQFPEINSVLGYV